MSKTLVEFPHKGGSAREPGMGVIIGYNHLQGVWQLQSWNGWKIADSTDKQELLDYIKEMRYVLEKDYDPDLK